MIHYCIKCKFQILSELIREMKGFEIDHRVRFYYVKRKAMDIVKNESVDDTGVIAIWPCSLCLVHYFYNRHDEFQFQHFLELGCGYTALPSLALASILSERDVAGVVRMEITDGNDGAMDSVRRAIEYNQSEFPLWKDGLRINVYAFDWAKRHVRLNPVDNLRRLVYAADVLYPSTIVSSNGNNSKHFFHHVVHVLKNSHEDSRFILSHAFRSTHRYNATIIAMAYEHGLRIQHIWVPSQLCNPIRYENIRVIEFQWHNATARVWQEQLVTDMVKFRNEWPRNLLSSKDKWHKFLFAHNAESDDDHDNLDHWFDSVSS